MENVISTLFWAALIQGVFLVGLYFFSKKSGSFANRLLGLFLLVFIYEGVITFLPFTHIFGYSLYYFALPEVKLLYPLFFFHYILEKVGRSTHYRTFLRLHYLLALAIAALTLINISLFVITGKKLEAYLGIGAMEIIFMGQQYYSFLLAIVVFFISIAEVKRYKRIVKKEFSDYDMLNINWLWRFIFSILPIILAWGINLLYIALSGENNYTFELATWAFVIIFLYFVSFQAFQHKNLFEGIGDRREESNDKSFEKESKEETSSTIIIGKEEDEELIQKIKSFMETQEPYLEASLNIYQLAQQIDISVRELSLLINHKLKKHFFDFVNEYRVKKAMEILRDPQCSQMTVLEILYEVGFNSKSSFNTVFKKITGKTPTQYRKASSL